MNNLDISKIKNFLHISYDLLDYIESSDILNEDIVDEWVHQLNILYEDYINLKKMKIL